VIRLILHGTRKLAARGSRVGPGRYWQTGL